MEYDFFVAGRWRNKEQIERIVSELRQSGKTVFSFLENDYSDVLQKLNLDKRAMESSNTENLPLSHPLIQAIFKKDMDGLRVSSALLLVLPAGIAAHMESGIAYGMGKKCYAIGQLDKTETLYNIFDGVFLNVPELLNAAE